jgi:hypothetical protein
MGPSAFRLSTLSFCLAGAAALAFGASALAEEEKVVNIYNWADYIAPDTIKNFEKETGIKVRYDNFDSNEVLHAKLVAGHSGYDIVVPGSHFAKMQIDGGLLMKLDKGKLPNLKNLDPAIQSQLAKLDPGNDYLVNWLWGYTTVGINAEKVKKALGALPMPDNAWDLVFKPEYASKLKGCGVSFLDTASEVIPIALKYIGKDPHSKDALVGRHLHRKGPCGQGQAPAGARSAVAEVGRPALLRRDGDSKGRQASRECAQVDQLHPAPGSARVTDERRLLCQPEQGSAQGRQARVGQRQGRLPRCQRARVDDRSRRPRPGHAPADDAHLHELQGGPMTR